MREYPQYAERFTCAGENCLEYHCPGKDPGLNDGMTHLVTNFPQSVLTIGNYEQMDLSLSCMEVGHLFFGPNVSFSVAGDTDLSTGDAQLDDLRDIRDQLVSTALDPQSPLEDLFALDETNHQLLDRMDSMEVLSEDWAKAVHAVKLLLRRPDYYSAQVFFKEQQGDLINQWFRRLGAYFFFRYTLDAYQDGDVAIERLLTLRSLKFLYLMCFARWSKRGHPITVYDMIDLAHVYSHNVEQSAKNLAILKAD